MADMVIELGSHVATERGEGFLVGLSRGSNPIYTVRLLDGTLCHSFCSPQFETMTLIEVRPINHPCIPVGMRDYIISKMSQLPVIDVEPTVETPKPRGFWLFRRRTK